MEKMCEKVYLQLAVPTEEDSRDSVRRITEALPAAYGKTNVPVATMRRLYPMCQNADWRITVTLACHGPRGFQDH